MNQSKRITWIIQLLLDRYDSLAKDYDKLKAEHDKLLQKAAKGKL